MRKLFASFTFVGAVLLAAAGPAWSGELTSGSTLVGAFSETCTSNGYIFQAAQGVRVKIQMSEIDEAVGPFMELFTPEGNRFAYADSECCKYRAAQFNLVLPATGVYRVVCRDRKKATGRYAISLVMIPASETDLLDRDIGRVKAQEKKTGRIDQPGDLDAAVFDGEKEAQVVIRMDEVDEAVDPFIQLYDPEGRCVAMAESRAPHRVAILETVLPKTGSYTILCQDRFVQTGRYLLIMDQIPPASNDVRRLSHTDTAP